jgi:transcriptional regulator with XRE-family HTH domain
MNEQAQTQRQFARELGVDEALVSRWIAGEKRPRKPEQAAALMEFLDRVHRERCEHWWTLRGDLERIKRKRTR